MPAEVTANAAACWSGWVVGAGGSELHHEVLLSMQKSQYRPMVCQVTPPSVVW